MWHFFQDAFGNWEAYYFDSPLDEYGASAAADLMLGVTLVVVVAIFGYIIKMMGSILYLPLACVLAGVGLFLLLMGLFGEDTAMGVTLVVTPLLMYAWACVCFGLHGAASGYDGTVPRGVGLIMFGLAMIVLCGGMADLLGGVVAVPLIAQGVIWIAAFILEESPSASLTLMKYTFRVLGIVAVVGLVLCVVGFARDHDKAGGARGGLGMLVALGLGLIPPVVGCLLGAAGPLVCVVATLATYVAVVSVPAAMGRRIPAMGLCLSYLVLFGCYLLSHGNLSSLPPLDVPNALAMAVANFPLVTLCGELMATLANAFAWASQGVVELVGGLFMGIFDSSMPSFAMPELVGCVVGIAGAVVALSVGDAVAARLANHR